jgi:hypothetical protein
MSSQRFGEPVGDVVTSIGHVVGADIDPAFAGGEDL